MKPTLTLFIEASCPACERARKAILSSAELLDLVNVAITDLSSHTGDLPSRFVGVPTTVLDGKVVALGTPDCSELIRLVLDRKNGDSTN